LENLGAANAHITDYVKSRGPVAEDWPDDIEADALLFERELAIIQPTVLVALGDLTFHTLRHVAAVRHIPLRKVIHYTLANRFNRQRDFRQQMEQALRPGRTGGRAR
jgi:uracil-DNA glycosylase